MAIQNLAKIEKIIVHDIWRFCNESKMQPMQRHKYYDFFNASKASDALKIVPNHPDELESFQGFVDVVKVDVNEIKEYVGTDQNLSRKCDYLLATLDGLKTNYKDFTKKAPSSSESFAVVSTEAEKAYKEAKSYWTAVGKGFKEMLEVLAKNS